MLLSLLYHKIGKGKYSNQYEMIDSHFEYISTKYKTVFPGEKIDFFKTNLCLTFDDAYFDFYHYVYPLLKKYKLKAVLAVPAKFIVNDTTLTSTQRLNVSYDLAMKDNIFSSNVPFCTWKELKEMADSGHVMIGSHSYNHINLLEKNVDLDIEINHSKKILETKLNKSIDTFIYPFGKFNKKINKLIRKNYSYSMRIGSAINFSWSNFSNVIYRIPSDNLKKINQPLQISNFFTYISNLIIHTIRGR